MSASKGVSSCKFDGSPELNRRGPEIFKGQVIEPGRSINCGEVGGDFAFPREQLEPGDDDEVIESKIRAFLVEKGRKMLQAIATYHQKVNHPRGVSRRVSTAFDPEHSPSPGSCSRHALNIGDINLASSQDVREILSDSRIQ